MVINLLKGYHGDWNPTALSQLGKHVGEDKVLDLGVALNEKIEVAKLAEAINHLPLSDGPKTIVTDDYEFAKYMANNYPDKYYVLMPIYDHQKTAMSFANPFLQTA